VDHDHHHPRRRRLADAHPAHQPAVSGRPAGSQPGTFGIKTGGRGLGPYYRPPAVSRAALRIYRTEGGVCHINT
jgi:hypothetical protein